MKIIPEIILGLIVIVAFSTFLYAMFLIFYGQQ